MSDLESDTSWFQTDLLQSKFFTKHELQVLFDKILNLKNKIFDPNFEQFISSIVYYSSASLIQQLKIYTNDEINQLESIIELYINYLIKQRSFDQERDDVTINITLEQYLQLIESFITNEYLIDENNLNLIVTNLKNSKCPSLDRTCQSTTSLNSLINIFLNSDLKIDLKNDSSNEIFSRICLKYFILNDGFNQILNELENNLTYLNVYRKNHLKQFNSNENVGLKSMTYEEALQAKSNLPYLINDLNKLNKFMNIIQAAFKLNDSIVFNTDKLSEQVQSSQIAMLQTCLAEFVLIENSYYQTKTNKNDDVQSSNEILKLIKLSVEILNKFKRSSDETFEKTISIQSFYLESLIDAQDNQLLKLKLNLSEQTDQSELTKNLNLNLKNLTISQLNIDLNSYILSFSRLLTKNFNFLFKLIRNAFLKSFLYNEQKKFNKKVYKQQSDVFNLNKIKNIDDPNTDEDNYDDENFHDDDDDDDEEEEDTIATTVTTYTNITQTNNQNDDEDYLLIGSWLYEQINSNQPTKQDDIIKETKVNDTNLSNSTQILDTTFDLDNVNVSDQGYVELIVQILSQIQKTSGEFLKNSLNINQIEMFSQILIDIESSKTISEKLVLSIYNFIKFLLIKNYINFEGHDLIIERLGLSTLFTNSVNLNVNKRYLSLLSQILIVRFNTSGAQEQAVKLWSNFLSTLTSRILEKEDVTLEHSAFLIFVFHNLTNENREQVLINLSTNIINLKTIDKETKTPHLVSRLLFFLDYFLAHFDQPSNLLIKLIDSRLLNLKSDCLDDEYKNEHEHFLRLIKPDQETIHFYKFKDIHKIYKMDKFYQLIDDYDCFYECLLDMKNFGCKLKYSDENLVNFVSISYNSSLVDTLTNPKSGLKIPQKFISDIQDLNQDQMYQILISTPDTKAFDFELNQKNLINLFVKFWSKQPKEGLNLDLLSLNLDLLNKLDFSSPELSQIETTLIELFNKLISLYKNDLFLTSFDQSEMDREFLNLLLSLSKYTDKTIEYDQSCFINLDQEDQFKNLYLYLRNFNENVSKKFDLVKNIKLKNLNWFCHQVNVIKVLQKLLEFCISLKSTNLDDIFLEIYANLNLFGPYLLDYLTKYPNLNKKTFLYSNNLIFKLLNQYFFGQNEFKLEERLFVNLVKQLENSLDQPLGLQGLLDFYDSKDRLLSLIKTTSSPKSTKSYFIQVISLLNKLFRLNYSSSTKQLVQVLVKLNLLASEEESQSLHNLLVKVTEFQEFNLNDKFILQQFVVYLTSESQINESVSLNVLNSLIELTSRLITESKNESLPGLVCLMDSLSSSANGLGHLNLFKACINWIEVYSGQQLNDSKHTQKSICYILSYLSCILNYLRPRNMSDNSELSKHYQDNLLIDFDKQTLKLFDLIEKKPESVIDDQDDGVQQNDCDLLETEIYENNPTIDDTCNDQDLDDNYDLNRDNSEDDENGFDEDEDDDDDEDNDDHFEPSEPSQPVVNQPPATTQNASLDVNELFGAYGVTYQIFDESGDVLRNENRLDDVLDEDDDGEEDDPDEEDDDEEYGEDFNDNFVDYENPTTTQSETNRNIYQDLISTINAAAAAAAAFNGRISTQTSNTQKPKKSDEDLNSKLCTYTITKKEFMNQHWYYCHTCKMVDRIGMCTICAKVCHADHDVSYAKFGSFFCDCGAKEDGSCKALQKRTEKKVAKQKPKRNKLNSSSSQTPSKDSTIDLLKRLLTQIKIQKSSKIEKIRPQILECLKSKNLVKLIQDLLSNTLVPKSKEIYENSFLNSNTSIARKELIKLHSNLMDLPTEHEQLFQVTLGSQEGAFENVRLTYTGDHGSQIKQLIQNHSLRRVSMCLVTSKKRQNLIVTHEKGKSSHLTILQLNALLKQDSNKRNKLTLTKLNTIPVPFTLLTVSANPSNEDYVSLTGLKDCYVMYLNENGQQTDTDKTNLIVLHPSLESSNYIIKSAWLPGSKTELALITSEFIKIYDLSIDKISPIYFFVLPMGKIKDSTFYYNKNGQKFIIIITSDGYLYYQELNDTSSAKNGIYYVTNTIDQTESVPNGVSIYYSFKLNLLFWSHQNGKTLMGAINSENNQFQFTSMSQLNLAKLNLNQALCNWSEIPGHPGLILTMTQLSNNPIILMFKSDKVYYQEIKMLNNNGVPSKAKIQDMVAIRHAEDDSLEEEDFIGLPLSTKEKTTMIILCDDGSLKIYVADSQKTDFWLSANFRPTQPILQLKSQWPSPCLYQLSPSVIKEITNKEGKGLKDRLKSSSLQSLNKKAAKLSKTKQQKEKSIFPIDYFEKCVQIKDIEFSGHDLLEIYNSQQLKTRLSDTNSSRYVSIKKLNNFKIEITNTNESNRLLIMGCRIMCGVNSIEKSPSYFEVFGRRISAKLNRVRWFDICLTREEAFIADNKLVITVGSSSDSTGLTNIDAIFCYGRAKTELNWTKTEATELQKKNLEKDKKDDQSKSLALPKKQSDPKKSFLRLLSLMEPKPFDYLLGQTIDLYETCCDLCELESEEMAKVSVNLLSLILPPIVLHKSKSLLMNSVKSQSVFNSLKTDSVLNLVCETLTEQNLPLIDFEIFEKCLLCLKSCLNNHFELSKKFKIDTFFSLLNKILWNLIDLKSCDLTKEIGVHNFSNLSLTIESLIEIEHYFLLNETFENIDPIIESYLKLLTSDSLQINFTARKSILNLLKPGVKKSKNDENPEDIQSLIKLRKVILDRFIRKVSSLFEINPRLDGLKSIAFFQVILSLLADISPKEETDKQILDVLIENLLNLLETFDESDSSLIEKSCRNEIRLIGLRTLSILLSKSKYQRSGTETCNFIIQNLVSHLIRFNLIDKCLSLLKFVLKTHWSTATPNIEDSGLVKVSSENLLYDELSPYFVKTDPLNKDSFIVPPPNLALLSENSNLETNTSIRLFDNYIELLTEILIRLPYQMKKLCLGSNPNDVLNQISSQFNFSSWTFYLCEYLMLSQCNYLKRLIKKLLQILCGSKDKYRKFKDQHMLSTSLNQLVSLCPLSINPQPSCMLQMGSTINEALDSMNNVQPQEIGSALKISKLSYLNLIKIVDNFKLILEVSTSRSPNWQKFCVQNPSSILYLIEMSLLMGIDSNGSGTDSSNLNSSSTTSLACTSVVIPTILQLLQSLFGQKTPSKSGETDENLCQTLVGIFFKQVNREMIIKFVRSFLLEAFQPQIRWSMHTLVYNLFKNSSSQNQQFLYDTLLSLWSDAVSVYGSKSSQYCDLIGFFVLKLSNENNQKEIVSRLIHLFKQQNFNLKNHPNSLIYENMPELDGYYLEPDSCFICNNLDQPVQSFKLNSIKVDSRFTTSQQIYKLSSTYSIQKILFKITDIRKTKMIQSLNIFFTNRTSHSIVDLKMNIKLWSKAKQIRIEPGQSEIKIDLQLPIICSNLMFEYSEFYDRDSEKTSESAILQCPRCSASVPAHPGVCTTCGENVFQCHKCRAINYDERDPFLCNACGFCKFAKFDINLIGRQFISIDPIENEEDRKNTIQSMNSLLDRADKIYTQMSQEIKPVLEALIIKQDEQAIIDKFVPNPSPPPPPSSTVATNPTTTQPVNPPGIIGIRMAPLTVLKPKNTQSITQKYAECKTKFDELAKIVLKLNLTRKELREYDKQFKLNLPVLHRKNSIISMTPIKSTHKCYGCASASLEHCFNAFRVLLCSNNPQLISFVKNELCHNEVLEEILNFNLRRNLNLVTLTSPIQTQTQTAPSTNPPATTTSAAPATNPTPAPTQPVQPTQTSTQTSSQIQQLSSQKLIDRDLINIVYLILKDNLEASERFERLVMTKLAQIMDQPSLISPNNLKYEIIILSSLIQKLDDSCWLMRFKLVINILLQSLKVNNSKFLDELSLPCLRIFAHLVKSSTNSSMLSNGKKIDLQKLMDTNFLLNSKSERPTTEDSCLRLKYFTLWKNKTSNLLKDLKWVQICLFCNTNRSIRQLTSVILQNLFTFYQAASDSNERKFLLVDIIGENIDRISSIDESHLEYLNVFKQVLNSNDKESKYRLVIKHKILNKLETLLQREIKSVGDLERMTNDFNQSVNLSFNLNRGLSIKSSSELLSLFLKDTNIRTKFKSRLIGTVLNSYLSLKKLLFQRTKLIDEAQEKLLNTLELLTSGTEQESRHFMSICIETINNFDLDDLVTPVFIFERLSNIIYPEEVVDNKEFLMILEKDPNQEDYLQGRMLGNPYSSNEPGLGPLMRNVKNKICTDSELIALLEDDNGMELLVHNKIISLDLNVRDVYKKVWLSECISEHEPMRVVYRMTGLSGDATEDIIDNLDPKNTDSTKNDEDIYRMAEELAHNGALPVMLERLGSINQQDFTIGKPLLRVLLKLFDYALKLKINRTVLIKPQSKTISTMLQTLNMMLKLQVDVSLTEKLISIMQVILSEASKQPEEIYNEFSALCGDREQLEFLLNNIKSTYVRGYGNLMQALMGLIPFLSFGDETKMKSLIEYFSTYISNFDEIDKTTTSNEDTLHLECFCVIVNGIEIGENGTRLRDMMNSSGIVQKSTQYLLENSPKITTYLNSDYDLWKDFIDRKSLPYVLRILTGLCKSHEVISDLIGESCIPVLHKLEQFSSGNLIGVLAEDLLVALKESPSDKISNAIEEVRTQTKNEKKKLAMAMRKKQLNQLGMKTNDKGQLIFNPDNLTNLQVEEERGHICCICREGYKYHPQKVLAIYTFSKKCDLESNESKTRKTIGFSTVTHFNLVHIDCHTNAIRSSRTCRDEWENAALQNANTKCNGLLPIWGPEVTETLFSNALARHNNYLLEATGIRDVNYILYVHDLKILLNRFAENLSFSEDSGGGGRESNINLVPYIIHAILYSINTAKYVQREERNLNNFIEQTDKSIQNSFECDNVFYYLSLCLCILKPSDWKLNRLKLLKRVLLTCHSRLVNTPTGDKQKLVSTTIQEFKKYKSSLLYIGLIDLLYKHILSKVNLDDQPWTEQLANYIRHNDINLMEYCKNLLKEFEEDLLVCEDWIEMFDVLGYLREFDISDPVEFLSTHLQSINK